MPRTIPPPLTHRLNRAKRKARVLKGWAVVTAAGTILPHTIHKSKLRTETCAQPGERLARVKIEECKT